MPSTTKRAPTIINGTILPRSKAMTANVAPKERELMAKNNLQEIKKYSWSKTSNETFSFLTEIYSNYKL